MEVPSYEPEHISVLLSSMISEAVPALLDQHDRYDINQLVQYLARNYPGIPAQMRAPVVIAATAGARQAALWHTVWEKNVASGDVNKRRFGGEAASALSFWALGLRPSYRPGLALRPVTSSPAVVAAVSSTPSTSAARPLPNLPVSPALSGPRAVLLSPIVTSAPRLSSSSPALSGPRAVSLLPFTTLAARSPPGVLVSSSSGRMLLPPPPISVSRPSHISLPLTGARVMSFSSPVTPVLGAARVHVPASKAQPPLFQLLPAPRAQLPPFHVQLPVPLSSQNSEFEAFYEQLSPISDSSSRGVGAIGQATPAGPSRVSTGGDEPPFLVLVSDDGGLDDDIRTAAVTKTPRPRYAVGRQKKRAELPPSEPRVTGAPCVSIASVAVTTGASRSAAPAMMPLTPSASSMIALLTQHEPSLPSVLSPVTTPRKRSHNVSLSEEDMKLFQEFRAAKLHK